MVTRGARCWSTVFLSVEKVLWASGALAGDDTDGHIDQFARFVALSRVVAARQPDRSDPNHKSLEANFDLLKKFKDARGRLLNVVPIDLPPSVCFGDVQLPASYLKWWCRRSNIRARLGCSCDYDNPEVLSQREVIAFPSLELIRG